MSLECPKCKSTDIGRKIIGTEFETFCKDCSYYNRTDYFRKENILKHLTKQHCDMIVETTDAFYKAERVVEGQRVHIFDYRLASISDFVDHNAFELRGLCFVEQPDGSWKRNLLLNKFFNVNQTEGQPLVGIYGSKDCSGEPKIVCRKGSDTYLTAMSKMIMQYEKILEPAQSWMYDDIKDKKIVQIQNKEDGSVISFVRFSNGNIRAKSKTSFDSEQAQMAQDVFMNNHAIRKLVTDTLNTGHVAIFELVGFENQIVLQYDEPYELVLLQIRDESGEYININQFNLSGIKVTANVSVCPNPTELDALLELKTSCKDDIEGWIITFQDGQKAKIKTDKYLSLHGLIGPDAFRENLLVKTILDGNIDDVISALTPGLKKDKIIKMDEDVSHKFNHLVVEFKELRRKYFQDFKEVRKDFAIKHSGDALFGAVMKSLNTDFKEIEKVAEAQVKMHILSNCVKLGDAKKWLESL